ncbi:MAG: hypothetical protein M3305_16240 [Actinomycetota bacterium]|nr:hypothetical protein [Actinomycetota bacterium]
MHTVPKKSGKKGTGNRNVPVHFGGISFSLGEYLCADQYGITIAGPGLLN